MGVSVGCQDLRLRDNGGLENNGSMGGHLGWCCWSPQDLGLLSWDLTLALVGLHWPCQPHTVSLSRRGEKNKGIK